MSTEISTAQTQVVKMELSYLFADLPLDAGLQAEDEGLFLDAFENIWSEGVDPVSILNLVQEAAEAAGWTWEVISPAVIAHIEKVSFPYRLEQKIYEEAKTHIEAFIRAKVAELWPLVLEGKLSHDKLEYLCCTIFQTQEGVPEFDRMQQFFLDEVEKQSKTPVEKPE